jgi:UPF0755 protein
MTWLSSISAGMIRFRKWMWLMFAALMLAITTLGFKTYLFLYSPISHQSSSFVLHIEMGSSATKVAYQLHEADYLDSPTFFVWYLRYQGLENALKAGEFLIDSSWTPEELVENLVSGAAIQYPATIVAGQTFKQVLQSLQQLPKLEKELDINSPLQIQQTMGIKRSLNKDYPYANLEGRLLPETYYYQAGDSDKDIVLRAHKALKRVLDHQWSLRDKSSVLTNSEEALILASIVEKETGYAPERAMIAGVFSMMAISASEI